MVLEVSATPYIFTFKLWDGDRLGLNCLPWPIHIDHRLINIAWDRDINWVRNNLINQVEPVAEGTGWREERTGLHKLEFIETRRHWFTGPTPHETRDTVNVLNLVEGEEAVVESPANAFDPFAVQYAETFIVPAAMGPKNFAFWSIDRQKLRDDQSVGSQPLGSLLSPDGVAARSEASASPKWNRSPPVTLTNPPPRVLLRNLGNGTFAEIGRGSRLVHPGAALNQGLRVRSGEDTC